MRCLTAVFLLLVLVAPVSSAAHTVSLGPGNGITLAPKDPPPCNGTLLLNGDGTWERGYAWEWLGVAPPDYGGFGEGYEFTGSVCGMQAHLTIGEWFLGYGVADAFVYDSDGENPLNVLSITVGIEIEDVAMWPEVSVHEIPLVPVNVDGEFFVYLWGNWPEAAARWTFAASINGPYGRPRTKCTAISGYGEGWHDVNVVFQSVRSMGIGAYVSEEPVPARSGSWGSVKALYRD